MTVTYPEADKALKIDDLYLSGFLACKGVFPTGVEATSRGRRYFVYAQEKNQKIDDLVARFYSGDVEVTLPILRARVKDMAEMIRHGR